MTHLLLLLFKDGPTVLTFDNGIAADKFGQKHDASFLTLNETSIEGLQLASIRKLYRTLSDHPQFPANKKGLAIEKLLKDDAIRALWDSAVAVAVPAPADLTRPLKQGKAKPKGGSTMEPQEAAQGSAGAPQTEAPAAPAGAPPQAPAGGTPAQGQGAPQNEPGSSAGAEKPPQTGTPTASPTEAAGAPAEGTGKAPKKAPKTKAPKPDNTGTKVTRQRAKPYWKITVNFTDNPRKGKCGARLALLKTGQTVKEFVDAGGETCDIILGEARGWISLDKTEPAATPAPAAAPAQATPAA